jgi:GH18 family chitinase
LSYTFTSSTYIQEPIGLTDFVSSTQPAVLATHDPNASTTFYVSFPDAVSEVQKVALAKKYGLRGVMFFKADGDIDPNIWNSLN